jgi:lipid II:glycine glycyltransferase (peptidoglycan interpeptide bridge formation enzyme)
MKLDVHTALDARQSNEWGIYLKSIGWEVEKIGSTQIFIHRIPLLRSSVIKIQHPTGPLPLQQIEEVAKKYRALFVLIEPHVVGYDEKSLQDNKYKKSYMRYAHTATIKISLERSEKELFASLSENARRNIKKAQKNDIRIEEIWFKDDKDNFYFDKFYSLLMILSKMKKFYSPSKEEYFKKMSAFKQTSTLLFAYGKDASEPMAVVWYASYGKIITYMQTGITQRGYDLLANYLLVWEGILRARKRELQVFDFETAYDPRYPKENKKWKGYTEFKKRFHGEVIEYPPTWIKIYNPLFNLFYHATSFFPQS